jgi:hypothetical protein
VDLDGAVEDLQADLGDRELDAGDLDARTPVADRAH